MNEKKLNGWNNNLTPLYGVGGKPGYHEKIATMTPEQKAKEIVDKYRKITYIDEYGNENYERLSKGAAKACAIEEVKSLINQNNNTYKKLLENNAQRVVVDIVKIEIELEKILTEIEKL